MFPTVVLVSDRRQFEDAWRNALQEAGAGARVRVVHPDALAQSLDEAGCVVIDAESGGYDEDELLASVGLARAMRVTTAVSLPEGTAFAGLEDLLEDLCAGLVVRSGGELRRVANALARRHDGDRAKRFEYLTVSPRPTSELLAVFGDGTALLLTRPVSEHDDGSEVASIALDGDAQSATVTLGSGRQLSLRASAMHRVNGRAAHVPQATGAGGHSAGALAIDGAQLGARLRELRLAAGLTQAELARRTGIHRPNIARVEAGRHTPSLETLSRLASAIGVSTTTVLTER